MSHRTELDTLPNTPALVDNFSIKILSDSTRHIVSSVDKLGLLTNCIYVDILVGVPNDQYNYITSNTSKDRADPIRWTDYEKRQYINRTDYSRTTD